MAQNFKYDRIASDMSRHLNELIDKIDDLDFVSVTDVELTKDMQDAKIYVESLTGNEEYVIKTLIKKEKFLKKEIAKKMSIRKIPNLLFKYDHRLDNYNKIDELLKK